MTITDNNTTTERPRWLKQFDAKMKSMPNVTTELPEKSLRRLEYSNDISFYESVN